MCGSVSYTENSLQDESASIGIGIIGGNLAGAALSKVGGWVAGLFGRTATTGVASAASEILAGKALTGFTAAQEAMIQKSLSALESAGYNTGQLKSLIRITDAPSGYAGISRSDLIAKLYLPGLQCPFF